MGIVIGLVGLIAVFMLWRLIQNQAAQNRVLMGITRKVDAVAEDVALIRHNQSTGEI